MVKMARQKYKIAALLMDAESPAVEPLSSSDILWVLLTANEATFTSAITRPPNGYQND